MELEACAGPCPPPPDAGRITAPKTLAPALKRLLGHGLALTLAAALGLAIWRVSQGELYTPATGLGYWLGVCGGSLMLALLIYPLRKRFRSLAVLGPLRHWFRFHLLAGIAGPVLVLFHSTFHIGSFNAAIALFSMLLVVGSGIVGRYLYRKIHHGLYGSRATAEELRHSMEQQMASLRPTLSGRPGLVREIARFMDLTVCPLEGTLRRAWHFLCLGVRRRNACRRLRQLLGKQDDPALHALAETLDETLLAIERSAYFATYEKLFSLWHVVHIPFLCMLVVTALIHVVAVHAY